MNRTSANAPVCFLGPRGMMYKHALLQNGTPGKDLSPLMMTSIQMLPTPWLEEKPALTGDSDLTQSCKLGITWMKMPLPRRCSLGPREGKGDNKASKFSGKSSLG